MGSVPMSDLVTIVVKAPNQQIADQIIQCHHSWTIKKLKDYLSEVYPSKPKLEEQKLIYSGKLLTDSTVLKDILRTYEGQENHTVHLVCTSKSQKYPKPTSSSSSAASVLENRSQSVSNDINQRQDNAQSRTTPSANLNAEQPPITGFRAPVFENATQFNANNFDPRYFWPSAASLSNLNNPPDMNQQYAYMQQAYAQYISQYMQMMGQPALSYMPSHLPQFVGTSQTPVPNNNDRPNAARENQPVVGAVGNEEDEENRNNRDWLDWFYVFSRIVILFSVVYFYSTPIRLFAVLLLLCVFYAHQHMRLQIDPANANNNNNNNNNVINHNNNQNNGENRAENEANLELAPATPPPPPQQQNSSSAAVAATNVTEEPNPAAAESATSTRPETATVVPLAERPSPVTITLSAIRSFFLSLVPDTHGL